MSQHLQHLSTEEWLRQQALGAQNMYPPQPQQQDKLVDRKDMKGKTDPFWMPFEAIAAFDKIGIYAEQKYGNRDTWKHSTPEEGVRRYLAAAVRHAWKIVWGEWIDPESNLPHVYAVVWNACVACWHYDRMKKDAV